MIVSWRKCTGSAEDSLTFVKLKH